MVSAVVGLLYPLIDTSFEDQGALCRDWSSVMKNVAFFVGINHASAVSLVCITDFSFYFKTV